METSELIAYYAKLLILEFRGKPKAYNTIRASVQPIVMDQLPVQVQDAFDLETAIGMQLDTLGIYVGLTRYGNAINGDPITLDDDDYRNLLKMGIIQNSLYSSLSAIQALLLFFFSGQIRVFDGKNMQLSYFMTQAAGSVDLAEVFITKGLFPKPMGVALAALIYLPVIDGLFGFRTYTHDNTLVSPYNSYTAYQTDYPWLSYADTITI